MHHDKHVRPLCEAYGVKLVYLPPYANSKMPIEMAFSKARSWLERHRALSRAHPREALSRALESVTDLDARGYFAAAGYSVPDWIIEDVLF